MPSGPPNQVGLLLRWLVRQPAGAWGRFAALPGYRLLTASDQSLSDEPPGRFRRAWAQLMLISLLWGVFLSWLWAAAWALFGDYYGMPLMHVAAVVAATTLWVFRRSLLAWSRCIGGADPRAQHLVTTVAVVLLMLTLLGMKRSSDTDVVRWLPSAWRWVFPMVVQRVLILAPLWGAWGMLVTCQFCKPTDDTEAVVAAFAKGCTAPVAAVAMVLPLAGTLMYLYFLNWWRLMVPGVTVLGAIAGGVLLCRATGGITRRALLANNILTQLLFLLAYLATR